MKLGQFTSDGSERHWAGVVSDDGIVNLNEPGRGAGVELPGELRSILGTWHWRETGGVILTGTPDGVGYFRDPQVLFTDEDTVTVGIDGLGVLTSPCQHTR